MTGLLDANVDADSVSHSHIDCEMLVNEYWTSGLIRHDNDRILFGYQGGWISVRNNDKFRMVLGRLSQFKTNAFRFKVDPAAEDSHKWTHNDSITALLIETCDTGSSPAGAGLDTELKKKRGLSLRLSETRTSPPAPNPDVPLATMHDASA